MISHSILLKFVSLAVIEKRPIGKKDYDVGGGQTHDEDVFPLICTGARLLRLCVSRLR
jgi:hypothetical protein